MKNVTTILTQAKNSLLAQLKAEQTQLTEINDALKHTDQVIKTIELKIKEIDDAIKALESKPKKLK